MNQDSLMQDHIREITKLALGITEKQKRGDITACKECGKSFQKKNYRHVYCSEECRIKAHGFDSKGHLIGLLKQG